MIRTSFWVAFLSSLVWASYRIAWDVVHARAINGAFGSFAPRVFMFPLWLLTMQCLLWFWFYRFGDGRARVAAGLASWWFGLQGFVLLMRMSIDVPTDRLELGLLSFWSLAHGVFALWGKRQKSRDVYIEV